MKKIFLQDTYLFNLKSTINYVQKQADSIDLCFNETIFHPQGGGQPSDKGYIIYRGSQYNITSLKNFEDKILHSVKDDGTDF